MTTYARFSHVLTAVLSALVGVFSPGEVRRARPAGTSVAPPPRTRRAPAPPPGGQDVDVPAQQRAAAPEPVV
ncbi:hypothetical protein [Saccharothrix longispora]|uniref:hypothetical protein n=1 Tax=Saccharothrix longispora TaxID=33920 RepID=UPI0028FD4280|nr:hypothetical protein [Saccharothrix longispora]MDU0294502.1 hypothetical protein [Saccharothrix longispora]